MNKLTYTESQDSQTPALNLLQKLGLMQCLLTGVVRVKF